MRIIAAFAGLLIIAAFILIGRDVGSPLHSTDAFADTPTCDATWRLENGPDDQPRTLEFLTGVHGYSPTDVWAVGFGAISTTELENRILIEHWNGSNWTVDDSAPARSNGLLTDIYAVARNDVWAVGNAEDNPLVLHWNGGAWSEVQTPVLGGGLYAVDAASSDDVWAVGFTTNGAQTTGLIEHWDGSSWAVAPVPGGVGPLGDVVAISPTDAWAVGSSPDGQDPTPVALHWDGSDWSMADVPLASGTLDAVSMVSASDVWAIGYSSGGQNSAPVTLHWNGSAWSVAPSPDPGSFIQHFSDLVTVSATDVWVVGSGYQAGPGRPGPVQKVVQHWDGTSWSVVPTPDYGTGLSAIVAISPTMLWAVGSTFSQSYENPGTSETVSMYYCSEATEGILESEAEAGASILAVADSTAFAAGDRIVINPGGTTEEVNQVVDIGSLVLSTPLEFAHSPGERVIRFFSGDADCSQVVNSADATAILLILTGLGAGAPCVAAAGDVDCNEELQVIDALNLLRFVVNLPAVPVAGCRPIGT